MAGEGQTAGPGGASAKRTGACGGARLRPLLSPRSIALVGASPRPGSVGHQAARALLESGFAGPISFVNPRHEEIEGRPCLGSLQDLAWAPDLVILNVGSPRMERTLEKAIEAGAKAAVIFDPCLGEAASGQDLRTRLRSLSREAGVPLCGGNGMGFLNVTENCCASFYSAKHLKAGGISLIAHSGSVFTKLALSDPRYRFDLVINPGQELGAGIDEYIDFVLSRDSTKVVALFMEAARNPEGFAAALEKARAVGKPVIVCKVGRTEESHKLALSHSGAMAGNAVAYDALFARCGAVVVESVDQLMNLAMLLANDRPLFPGEAAMVTDSGGLRELFIDRAKAFGLPLALLSGETLGRIREALPAHLEPSNPLDCAGAINEDYVQSFDAGLRILAQAPEVSFLGFEMDATDEHCYEPGLVDLAKRLPEITEKPCCVYTSFARMPNRQLSASLADAGVPLLNGLDETIAAIAGLRRLREMRQGFAQEDTALPVPHANILNKWRQKLSTPGPYGDVFGLEFLADIGITVAPHACCENWLALSAAAEKIGYPLVLKTAAPEIVHKSDQGGVFAGIRSAAELESAYRDLSKRLGRRVLLQAMVPGGTEVAFGYLRDPEFGPLVMVSAGGTLIEILNDRRFALAPFGRRRAEEMIRSLKILPLLEGVRGAKPCDLNALTVALAAFSAACAALSDCLSEMDVNPVILSHDGLVAVDALMIAGKT